ncbi:hypothetical protein FSU_3093 [Fibrobacter succinogenes subsp. succinogenes S85]|uniref:Uncharacterized protein n=1 Tax=Fibrobacter succinogenes (strain ATCC 19169 / S85) TaxID=59374 RepID=D9S886_FIBSS|nr:hypothetical protein FSU_3093 [Fibrobacter succinogenes subsp. succinogenes S85]
MAALLNSRFKQKFGERSIFGAFFFSILWNRDFIQNPSLSVGRYRIVYRCGLCSLLFRRGNDPL